MEMNKICRRGFRILIIVKSWTRFMFNFGANLMREKSRTVLRLHWVQKLE